MMNSQKKLLRRAAIKSAAIAGAASLTACWLVPRDVLGGNGRIAPSDRVHLGVVGNGFRGKYLIANLPEAARVVSLCDCSRWRMAETRRPKGAFAKLLTGFTAGDARKCSTHQDYRRMLDKEKLDALIVATSDHHHALCTVLACQAGLDVYVEKPLAVTIGEGRAIVDAVRKYDRVVQVGSQQRTMQVNRFACQFIRDGGLGNVSLVQLPNLPGPMRYESLPEEPVPQGLDWDLFRGPTQLRPHHRRLWVKDVFQVGELLWRGWDLWREYSGHLMTNWGAHSIDMVQYSLGMDAGGPVEIWPEIEQLAASLADQWKKQTPALGTMKNGRSDMMRFCPVSMRYSDGTLLQFVPGVKGTVFHGEKGKFFMSRNKYRTEPADLIAPPNRKEQRKWAGPGHVARPHLRNWIDCLTSRAAPNAPVEVGHRTATICHLANIARELGRRLHWNPQTEEFARDEEANRLVHRARRQGFELPELK